MNHFKQKISWLQVKWAPYIFISPFYILFLAFGLFPILFSLYLSLHKWHAIGGFGSMEWIGLENYIYLFTDPWFWKSIWNTIWLLVVSGLPQHLIAIPLAFILNMKFIRNRDFFVSSFFLPYITSTVAIALIFFTIYGTQYGVLNQALGYLMNIPVVAWFFKDLLNLNLPINWLGNAKFIKPGISMLLVWRWFGWNTVLYLAGLQSIDDNLYEAARVDGASVFQQFWHITLPLLKPIAFFAVTLTLIGTMQLFDEPFILTNGTGGTSQSGLTTALYLYRTGFEWLYMGSAAAMSWVLFIFIGGFSFINNKLFGKDALK